MAVGDIVPVLGDSFEQTLTKASPDMPRELIRGFAQKVMDTERKAHLPARRPHPRTGAPGSGWMQTRQLPSGTWRLVRDCMQREQTLNPCRATPRPSRADGTRTVYRSKIGFAWLPEGIPSLRRRACTR